MTYVWYRFTLVIFNSTDRDIPHRYFYLTTQTLCTLRHRGVNSVQNIRKETHAESSSVLVFRGFGLYLFKFALKIKRGKNAIFAAENCLLNPRVPAPRPVPLRIQECGDGGQAGP
jgi:hypothetical protein